MKVVVVGGGSWGSVFAVLLAERGHEVALACRDPEEARIIAETGRNPRYITDLDLSDLPAAGPFAHVTAIVRRNGDGWFNVYVQQELGHYVAEAVVDTLAGLENP